MARARCGVGMHFEWDDIKNAFNIRKHGIDFNDATGVFAGNVFTMYDGREDYGEDRWLAVGWCRGLLTAVVYTVRADGSILRLISARAATRKEQRHYEQDIRY